MEIIEKDWGYEQVLVNNDHYCAKILHIYPGWECSLHYHRVKKETFICIEGKVDVEVMDNEGVIMHTILIPGQDLTLEPGTPHRFSSQNWGISAVLEVSTPHSDEDVVRFCKSRPIMLPGDMKDAKLMDPPDEYGQTYAKMVLNL